MNYLLDTCVVSDLFKKIPSVINNFEKVTPSQIFLSSITAMEIEYGLSLHPERERKLRPIWTSFLKFIQVVPYSLACAKATAEFRAYLKDSGKLIGPYDLLIAGTAVNYGYILVTSNMKEFERIKDVTIVNWR